MTRSGREFFALLLAALLLACSTASERPAAPPAPAAGPFQQVALALCEDYPPESTTDARVRRDFRLLRELGVERLRVSLGWDDLEPEPGHYDFRAADAFVRLASGEFGIELLPYVCYTPAWAAQNPGSAYNSPPRDPAAFGALMRRLAERYAREIQSWELWNEPDNRDYFTGSVAEYAALLEQGARGVRDGNPAARVVLGGIADDLGFLEELLREHGAARFVDVVNVHRYPETWTGSTLESTAPFLERAAQIIDQHGEAEPMWLAEIGYSSFRRGGWVSEYHRPRYDYEHTPRFQAVALLRLLAIAHATSTLELFAWYEISDLPPESAVIGDVNNRHLGILDAQGAPKPAFHAWRQAVSLFSGPLRPVPLRISSTALPESVHVRAFQRPDGSGFLLAWLDNRGPGGGRDPRRVRLTLGLPMARSRPGIVPARDERGRRVAEVELRRSPAGLTVEGLELGGGEIRIVVLP